jgi:hypothetical protein
LANPPRTWLSEALAYCLQNPGSAAWALVNPVSKTIDEITVAVSLLAMPPLPNPLNPSRAILASLQPDSASQWRARTANSQPGQARIEGRGDQLFRVAQAVRN